MTRYRKHSIVLIFWWWWLFAINQPMGPHHEGLGLAAVVLRAALPSSPLSVGLFRPTQPTPQPTPHTHRTENRELLPAWFPSSRRPFSSCAFRFVLEEGRHAKVRFANVARPPVGFRPLSVVSPRSRHASPSTTQPVAHSATTAAPLVRAGLRQSESAACPPARLGKVPGPWAERASGKPQSNGASGGLWRRRTAATPF